MVGLTFVVGGRLIPWLLDRVAATRSRELFTLTVLVVALGIAVGSAKLFGVSMALGAFLAGMVVGRSEFSLRAATEALPMRDAFAVLFFVSVGMLFDPRLPARVPGLVAATLGVILVGKPLAALGHRPAAQIPAAGRPSRSPSSWPRSASSRSSSPRPGRTSASSTTAATNALIAAAIISITLNPILYRLIDPLETAPAAVRQDARHPGGPAAAGAESRKTPAATGPSSSVTARWGGPWPGCSARTRSSRSSSS